jgi:hypothetical protein
MHLTRPLWVTFGASLMAACAMASPGRDSMDLQQRHVIVELPASPAPRQSDVTSPEAVVLALYETISGPSETEQERDWSRFQSLLSPDATFRLGRWFYPDGVTEEVRLWSVEQFIAAGRLMWRESGFWERELWNRVEVFGHVAHVWSAYEGRVDSPDTDPVTRGVNSFQLIQADGRWWLVSTTWDVETMDNRVPLSRLESGT